ncbi:MAG: CoB--CoM heterodisulfide reductase iron-sulfur subunit A [Promethearchaeota archaeon]|nr:MAG: CoB--CoM heterodisulfide reductase iron-sulfur subunit A [Candidatus Lokiarchaeota archaeon]
MSAKVYRKLQQHLDKKTIAFPPTKSGIEIRLLKKLFTEEEAEIALGLKFSWDNLEPLEEIFSRLKHKGKSFEELEENLDNMAKKGVIMALKKGKDKTYGLANFMIGMWDYQVNKLTVDFLKDSIKYLYDSYIQEIGKIPTPQTRLIPVRQDLNFSTKMAPFDDIEKILHSIEGPFMVTNCVCRQGKDLITQPCEMTERREVCISFGYAAERYIQQGWGREIDKKEALEILKKNAEDGLIHQINNAQKPDFICSCCVCCCEAIKILNSLPMPAKFIKSNYYARINSDQCDGCGVCLDRCQMDAITPKSEIFTISKRRCIGCGNCIDYCPNGAIQLKVKRSLYVPPETGGELYEEIINIKNKAQKNDHGE